MTSRERYKDYVRRINDLIIDVEDLQIRKYLHHALRRAQRIRDARTFIQAPDPHSPPDDGSQINELISSINDGQSPA